MYMFAGVDLQSKAMTAADTRSKNSPFQFKQVGVPEGGSFRNKCNNIAAQPIRLLDKDIEVAYSITSVGIVVRVRAAGCSISDSVIKC